MKWTKWNWCDKVNNYNHNNISKWRLHMWKEKREKIIVKLIYVMNENNDTNSTMIMKQLISEICDNETMIMI